MQTTEDLLFTWVTWDILIISKMIVFPVLLV